MSRHPITEEDRLRFFDNRAADFHEPDEPVADVIAAFDQGNKGLTANTNKERDMPKPIQFATDHDGFEIEENASGSIIAEQDGFILAMAWPVDEGDAWEVLDVYDNYRKTHAPKEAAVAEVRRIAAETIAGATTRKVLPPQ